MAQLTGTPQVFSGDTSIIDSNQKFALGTKAVDNDGNEYIYLKGVASTAAGSWVTMDEDNLTTLATSDAVGRVGVAMAAIVANKFGWYQIYGHCATAKAVADGDCAADVQLYLTSTGGSVDDVDAAGDAIIGAISRVAETVTAGYIEAELNYPFVCDVAMD